MTRQLLVLRHGEAENGSGVEDYDRALAIRGYAEVELIAKWLQTEGHVPEIIFGSSAERAAATAFHTAGILELDETQIAVDQTLYLAPKKVLLDFIATIPDEARSVMIVGHNPGLEDLVSNVVGYDSFANAGGKMATATVACIEFDGDWDDIMPALPTLKFLKRPIDVV
ncbi:MAG: histidine phosphatase family protein [Alphaproteobacteria bacterium]|nr:histidine phosphatase family protein [Alphaproteobacteria bacterium]